MRDSADSDDYGVTRRGNKRGTFYDEDTFAKRDRHVKRLATEEAAADRTDGLPPGVRWSTWDQTQNLVPNDPSGRSSAHKESAAVIGAVSGSKY